MKCLIYTLSFILLCFQLNAQVDTTTSVTQHKVLKIGIKAVPPFVYDEKANLKGLSEELWMKLSNALKLDYETVYYEDVASLLGAVQNNEIDLTINPITVTAKRMKEMSFSQPYYITSTVIVSRNENLVLSTLKNFFSSSFWKALIILIGVIAVFGFLIWLFEKNKNPDQFRDGLKGIGDGFWWSAVTMTTVGYGDKSPVTFGGRFIGFIWMFVAIIIISGLTASISTALTLNSLGGQVSSIQDLSYYHVGTIEGTSAADLLSNQHIGFKTYKGLDGVFNALQSKEIDFIVYEKPILHHYIQEHNLQKDLLIQPQILQTDYYSFAFSKNNPLVKVINPEIVKKIRSLEWQLMLETEK